MLRSQLGDLSKFLEKTFLLSNNSKSSYKTSLIVSIDVILLLYCAIATYFLGLEKSLEGSAYFVAIGSINVSQHVLLYFNQDKIKQLLNILKIFQEQHKEKWEKEIFQKGSKEIWNVVYKYCVILITYVLFYHTLPFIADLIIGNIYSDFPSIRVQIPSQAVIDLFEPRTTMSFIAAIPGQLTPCLAIPVHSGIQTLILVSIFYIKTELKIIKHKIIKIKHNIQEKENNFQIVAEKILNETIKQHQMVLEGLDSLKDLLGLTIAIQNTSFSLCLCFNFYCIITFNRGVNFAAKFNGIFSIVVLGFILLYLCHFGESLETENNQILNALYDLPWYNQNKYFRNTLLMMLRQAQKPFVINYRLQATLNLHAFMQIVNTSYSYLMMLKSTVNQ